LFGRKKQRVSDPATPAETDPRPVTRRRWLLVVASVLLAGMAVLGAWLWLGRSTATPGAPPERDAALSIEVWAGGQPVKDAQVTAIAGNRWRRSVTTDPDGRSHILGCPRAELSVVVEAAGSARATRVIDLSGGSAGVRIELEPGAVLRGRVHDESDRPVPAAIVVARIIGDGAMGSQEPWSVTSAADGSFSIDTLPRARITLEVSDGGHHEPAVVAEVVVPSDETLDVLMRRTAGLAGRVLGANRKPVAGVQVTLAGSGVWPARTLTTNAEGEFLFDHIPEGIYEVRAELNDMVSAPIEGVTVSPGNDARVEMALLPGATLRGAVRDIATGRALPGAEVEVLEESLSATPKRVRSAVDGHFEVAPLRLLTQRVTVRAPGYVTAQSWIMPGGAAFSADLLRAVTVSGSVQDADGRPVSEVELEVSGRSETGYAVRMLGPINEPANSSGSDGSQGAESGAANLGVTRGTVPRIPLGSSSGALGSEPAAAVPMLGDLGFRSDERGEFRLEGLPPGELVLAGHKLGFGVGRSRPLQARAGVPVTDVLIVMPRGAALTGRVVDGHGMPVAHVRVDLVSASEPARSTVSGDNGGFRFDAVRGPCTVQARAVGAPLARLDVAAEDVGRREVELVLESATERLLGRVLDSRERPIEAASIHLETGRGRTFSATALSGADGTFEFGALPAPPYVVQVDHSDYTPSTPVGVTTTSRPLQIRLEAGADLSGVVLAAHDQEPIAGARVSIRAGEVSRSGRSARDGTFEFRHLPIGNYMLFVEADRFVSERRQSLLEASAANAPFERVALARAGSIAGAVVDRLGATVWNAEVAPDNPPDWQRAVRSDHAGHFELAGLAPGERAITARHGGKQPTESSLVRVRVYEGEQSPGVVLRFDDVVDDTREEPEPAAAARRRPSAPDSSMAFALQSGSVVIERISAASPGARSGLEAGDVLVSVDGEPVRSMAQARGMLAPGLGRESTRTLEVLRAGKSVRLRYVAGR
jgi:protocatechuate 3,4-dioxygenase beta subunit